MVDLPPMADLAKCRGNKCSVRDTCSRYTAPPADYQTWLIVADGLQGPACSAFVFRGTVYDLAELRRRAEAAEAEAAKLRADLAQYQSGDA